MKLRNSRNTYILNRIKINMLNTSEFLKKFNTIQSDIISITDKLILQIKPGMSEKDIADKYNEMLKSVGLKYHWYPILIYSGDWTGKPITRRVHLPSEDVIIKKNDIVVIDSTPIDKTVWGNWCRTVSIGNNKFYKQLCDDCDNIVDQTWEYGKSHAKTIGDIFDFCMNLIKKYGLTPLDSRDDVGHSIFQVPEGQSVDKTPLSDRIFLNEEYRNTKLKGIISIEPQVGRINPEDGKMYGAKQQKVIIYDFD